jgi:hypothetical protein
MSIGPVAVEELHPPDLRPHRAELLAGPKRAIDDRAIARPPQLGAHERAPLAGLHVLELNDLEDRSVHIDVISVAKLICAQHRETSLVGLAGAFGHRNEDAYATIVSRLSRPVRISVPPSPTTTRSSIRTPSSPGR